MKLPKKKNLLCGPHLHARGPQNFLRGPHSIQKKLLARGPQIFPLRATTGPRAAVCRHLIYNIAAYDFFKTVENSLTNLGAARWLLNLFNK